MQAGMQRFSLRRAVNIQKPLYVAPPPSEAPAIRAEWGGGPALTAPGRELQHERVHQKCSLEKD